MITHTNPTSINFILNEKEKPAKLEYMNSSSKIIVMYHAVAITLFLRSELFPIIISLTNYHLLKIKSCKWVGQKGGINIYKIL